MDALEAVTELVYGLVQELSVDVQECVTFLMEILGYQTLRQILRNGQGENGHVHGCHRSLVRLVGQKLPLRPITRVHFKFARNTSFTDASLAGSVVGDRKDVIERKQNAVTEWQIRNSRCSPVEDQLPFEDLTETQSDISESPVSVDDFSIAGHSQSTVDTAAMNKISALEEEISRLKEQVFKMLVVADSRVSSSDYGSAPSTPLPTSLSPPHGAQAAPICMPPPPPPLPLPNLGVPPPPPPLPLLSATCPAPPPTPSSTIVGTPKRGNASLADMLQSKSLKSASSVTPVPIARGNSVPNMSDVLKGLNKVKLKKIERTPNGTPVKDKTTDPNDHGAILAKALAKRFKSFNQQMDSPDRAKLENDSGFDSPDESSKPQRRASMVVTSFSLGSSGLKRSVKRELKVPDKSNESPSSPPPFGQHLLRKTSNLRKVAENEPNR
ncbi:mitochondrial fission regulator 1-like [Artemia franciscana]|uniref:Mitochondrial fission regulator 2 n=1 Tax=Artemia franciscana TaxID=6661 RepID=A0AA88IBM2_ARTSF|nr:hypothetical protein QYM36_002040 [Artemia franciscana]